MICRSHFYYFTSVNRCYLLINSATRGKVNQFKLHQIVIIIIIINFFPIKLIKKCKIYKPNDE